MSDSDFQTYVREQFALMHQGFQTIHGRITDLERQQTDRINETREEIRNWTDERLVRHGAALAARIDGNIGATQSIQGAFGAHAAQSCPGAHPAAACPSVKEHEERHHNATVTWTIIGAIIAACAIVSEWFHRLLKG